VVGAADGEIALTKGSYHSFWRRLLRATGLQDVLMLKTSRLRGRSAGEAGPPNRTSAKLGTRSDPAELPWARCCIWASRAALISRHGRQRLRGLIRLPRLSRRTSPPAVQIIQYVEILEQSRLQTSPPLLQSASGFTARIWSGEPFRSWSHRVPGANLHGC
jgi:hypothetical protein